MAKDDYKVLGEVAELVRKGDQEGAISRIANAGIRLASDIPVLGKLGEEGLHAIFARTSKGQLKRAVGQLNAEMAQTEQAKQVAVFVADLLRDALYDLHDDQAELAAALQRLDERHREMNTVITGRDEVEIDHVTNGQGVVVSGRERLPVTAKIGTVSGGIGFVSSGRKNS